MDLCHMALEILSEPPLEDSNSGQSGGQCAVILRAANATIQASLSTSLLSTQPT